MKTNRRLWKKWCGIYIGQLMALYAFIYSILVIGKFVCEHINRIWSRENMTYIVLKWFEDNQWNILLFIMLISAILLAFYRFYVTSKAIKEIYCAVNNIYEEKDENLSLAMELGQLENRLNELKIKNKSDKQAAKEANQRKNELIMYMAHDLKTPLTSVIGYLTLVCEEREIPLDVKERYMQIALKKAHRLEELTNEFFDITRFNFSHMILEKSSVNLSVMLQQMVSEFMTEYDKKGLSVECRVESECWLFCDAEKLERVFDNILKNIMNYSYPDSQIHIVLRKSGKGKVEIITENPGKTIPKEMQEHIFEQFFRIDSSRTSEAGGAGIGLAVAKEIITLHGGEITCTSDNEIIRFRIVLPGCLR